VGPAVLVVNLRRWQCSRGNLRRAALKKVRGGDRPLRRRERAPGWLAGWLNFSPSAGRLGRTFRSASLCTHSCAQRGLDARLRGGALGNWHVGGHQVANARAIRRTSAANGVKLEVSGICAFNCTLHSRVPSYSQTGRAPTTQSTPRVFSPALIQRFNQHSSRAGRILIQQSLCCGASESGLSFGGPWFAHILGGFCRFAPNPLSTFC
jgi:hypothetical protein